MSTPMQTPGKILVCASTAGHLEHFHLPYLLHLQRLGWEVHTACRGTLPDNCADKKWDIPFQKRLLSPRNLWQAVRLRRLFKREQYDLILIHTSLAAAWCRLAFWRGDCPQTTLAYVCHGYFFTADDSGAIKPSLKNAFYLLCERLLAPRTDLLFTMNQTDQHSAQRYRLGRSIRFLYGMGLNSARYPIPAPETVAALRAHWGAAESTTVFLSVGEFSPRKNQKALLFAAKQLAEAKLDFRLVLAGSGALEGAYRAYVAAQHLESYVLFAGQVESIAPYYRAADLLLSASRCEGLPFCVMEALYMGCPVIASAIKGHTDLITQGDNGLLYPLDHDDMLYAIMHTLRRGGALLSQMRARASLPSKYLYENASQLLFDTLIESTSERNEPECMII